MPLEGTARVCLNYTKIIRIMTLMSRVEIQKNGQKTPNMVFKSFMVFYQDRILDLSGGERGDLGFDFIPTCQAPPPKRRHSREGDSLVWWTGGCKVINPVALCNASKVKVLDLLSLESSYKGETWNGTYYELYYYENGWVGFLT